MVICIEMKKRNIITLISICLLWNFTLAQDTSDSVSGYMKITLREAANQLLLSKGDSTSLILPVKELRDQKYQISFEKETDFEPNRIVDTFKESFQKANIERDYLVEVKQCSDGEVAYSYLISLDAEKTIVPCAGRQLPKQCYHIEVTFLNDDVAFFDNKTLMIIIIVVFALAIFYYAVLRKKSLKKVDQHEEEFKIIGGFLFYKDQNILIKQHDEIVLSKKECELLEIFSENINSVVKREELTKKVWEDKGVIVGRSLDTYISKLRKKLQSDSSIRITNIHGVGYKLEVTESED